MKYTKIYLALLVQLLVCCTVYSQRPSKHLNALILDGTNNHYVWPKTSLMMKDYLEQTGLFKVTISRPDTVWQGIKYFPNRPEPYGYFLTEFQSDTVRKATSKDPLQSLDVDIDFRKYDLIVSNLGAFSPLWPERTRRKFEKYVKKGGGLVIVHAANNAWGNWDAYNKMIGLGAWGDRDASTGPFVYMSKTGEVKKDHGEGICASHGQEHEFTITHQQPDHPILRGLPKQWLHAKDELYDRMRGPFVNATILATAYSDPKINKQPYEPILPGTGKNVPMLITINYGKGKVFHSTLGHFDYSMECIGFITTFQRGAEWAATGRVTQEVPGNFPGPHESKSIKWIEPKNK